MSIKTYDEDFFIAYRDISELSYFDNNKKYIIIYINNEPKGKLEVYTDRENDEQEYIIINCEIIYLTNIRKRENY